MRVRRIGHKYFSAEKSRDPVSRRRAPTFDSPRKPSGWLAFYHHAGKENRTPVSSSARTCSATKPYPLHCHNNLAEKTKKRKCDLENKELCDYIFRKYPCGAT